MTLIQSAESFTSFSNGDRREKIAVIGGGIAGSLAARALSAEGYRVSIIEEEGGILNGTSAGAIQGHLGGLYSGSLETAIECMDSTIQYAQELPFALHKGREAQFLVADSSEISMDEFVDFYDTLKDHYATLPLKDQIFGPPENLYRVLGKNEFAYAKNIEGGIATQEPGLDMERLRLRLDHEFGRQGVNLYVNTTVLEADVHDGQFVLTTQHENTVQQEAFDQVVNAGGYRARILDHNFGDRTNYHLNLKTWNFVRNSEAFKDSEPLPPFYVVRGSFIHHSPFGHDGLINLFASTEGNTYLGNLEYGEKTPELPDEWLEMMRSKEVPDKASRQQSIIEYAHDMFLKEKRVEPVDLRPGVAVSFSANTSDRTRRGANVIVPGWQTAVPTKATNALDLAKEVTENALKYSGANESLSA